MSANIPSASVAAIPAHCTRAISGEGGEVLTHAVRTGGGHLLLLAWGALCALGGIWAAYWLLADGGLTAAAAIFLILVPGGAILFGADALNIALWLRHEYLLGRHGFPARAYSHSATSVTRSPAPTSSAYGSTTRRRRLPRPPRPRATGPLSSPIANQTTVRNANGRWMAPARNWRPAGSVHCRRVGRMRRSGEVSAPDSGKPTLASCPSSEAAVQIAIASPDGTLPATILIARHGRTTWTSWP